MRWDNLFDDLEGQLEHELTLDEVDLRAEQERLRLGRLTLRSRLVGLGTAAVLRIGLVSGESLTVRPTTFGRDWLAADILIANQSGERGSAGSMCVLPFAAIVSVVLHSAQIPLSLADEAESAARLVDRIGLPFVLRDLCRRRKRVTILTVAGEISGTIDRVGRDHFDLAVHAAGSYRRAASVTEFRIVPLAHIVLVKLD
ncbi:hypothetical protein GCM10022381_37780 [Leifsonia kafniensis]|uniref:Uncharacterized protein n=1 Tax=Leifsonia kafniensis TaxID=475957 RepID=A0ABP7L0D6_9MICO